jgi:proteasome beta subunit
MGTAIGLECAGGAVLAADRVVTRGGSVLSRSTDKLFTFETVGTAGVGDRNGLDRFEREFDAAVRSYRTERGDPTGDAVIRMTSRVAAEAGVDVLVVARDGGQARLHTASADGSTLGEEYDAIGTGAQLALGQLESLDRDIDLSTAASTAEEVLATVSQRDPATGAEADVWQLAHATAD